MAQIGFSQSAPSAPPAATDSSPLQDTKSLLGLPKIEGENLWIHWSKEKDVAFGLSKNRHKYAVQALPVEAKDTDGPQVAKNVAVWRVGSRFYAFSGQAVRWDVLALGEHSQPTLSLSDDAAEVSNGDSRFVFSAETGQWSAKDGNTGKNNQNTATPAPFTASLLILRSDWSKSPFAKRVEGDLRKAVEGVKVSQELLDKLPASGSQVLFPPEVAAIYSAESYGELLLWLQSNGLVERQSWFNDVSLSIDTTSLPNNKSSQRPKVEFATRRIENGNIAALKNVPLVNNALVSQWTEFRWAAYRYLDGQDVHLRRQAVITEQARGQERESIKEVLGSIGWRITMLKPGEVAIVSAFPLSAKTLSGTPMWPSNTRPGVSQQSDSELRIGMQQREHDVFIVIEKAPRTPPSFGGPMAVHLPEKVEVLSVQNAMMWNDLDRIITDATEPTTATTNANAQAPADRSNQTTLVPKSEAASPSTTSIKSLDKQSSPTTDAPSGLIGQGGIGGNSNKILGDNSEAARKNPAFVASLLFVKADWLQSPAAKEIDADWRKALGEERANLKLLGKSPSPQTGLLFPTGGASIYTQEHYAQLLAWLKARQLFQQIETFKQIPSSPNDTSYTVNLTKDIAMFGTPPLRNQDDLFIAPKSIFSWTITAWTTQWNVDRNLLHYKQGSGQEKPQFITTNDYERCSFSVPPLPKGQVAIVHAFPATEDVEYLNAAHQQGLQALIVLENRVLPVADAAEPRLLLPDKIERFKAERIRGERGGVGFPTISQTNPEASGSQARSINSKDVMISWSEAKDVAWGFSKSLGKWVKQELNPLAGDTRPTLHDNVAVWQVGSTFYAFSSKAGRWDVLRLPASHSAKYFIDQNDASVHDGEDLYAFAGSTGRWSSPKGSVETTDSKPEEPRVKVFTLRNMQARDAERIFNQLFGREIQSAAVDERTNSLIVRATAADEPYLNIVYAILTRLDDEELGKKSAPPAAVAANRKNAETAAAVAELTSRYETKDRQALALARQIRELPTGGKNDKDRLDKPSAELRREVSEAFAARQQLQQAELSQLQQRITSLQQNLKTRERLNQEIIDRRVKDLLNPDLQWESTSQPLGGTGTAQPPQANHLTSEKKASSLGPDQQPAHAIRDIYRDNVQRAEKDFQAGQLSKLGLMWAKWQLADAEYKAASVPANRLAEREAMVEYLRENVAEFEQMLAAGTGNQADVASAQVALLNAERELANEKSKQPQPKTAAPETTAVELSEAEVERIWNSLGVKVRAVTNADHLQEPGNLELTGAVVTEIRPHGPADGPRPLRIGDIITDVGRWEVTSPQRLAYILSQQSLSQDSVMERLPSGELTQRLIVAVQRKGVESGARLSLPIEVVLILSSGNSATQPPSRNLESAKATRDKVREYVQGAEKAFQAGRLPEVELLRYKSQLADAEFQATTDPAERLAAKEAKVEHLKKIVTIIEQQVALKTVNETELQSWQAKLLKAEGELAAEANPSTNQGNRIAAPPAKLIVPGTTSATMLRTPADFRQQLQKWQNSINSWKSMELSAIGGRTNEERAREREKGIRASQQELDLARAEYEAQIRLLELELQDAQSAVKSAEGEFSFAEQQFKAGIANHDRLSTAERALQEAQHRLERAKTLLDLYRKADPKSATDEQPKPEQPPEAKPT